MIASKDLSSLLANLYRAPLEPEMWQVFFHQLCALTRISSGYLIASHPTKGNTLLAGGGLNFDPEVFHLYNEHYGANDPYRAPLIANPKVGLITGEELVDHSTLVKSELYNEVLSRYDLEYMNMLSCNCSQDQADLLSLWRSPKAGPMDAASGQLLETLIPHVQTALLLGKKVVACDESNLFSEVALDAMSIAALLVTGSGYVRHMNQPAVKCLADGDGIILQDGRLTATNSRDAAQLDSLIAGAASSAGRLSDALPGGALKLSRLRATTPLHVIAIPAPQQSRIIDGDSLTVVFLGDTSSKLRSRATMLRSLYKLTPTECRLADLLLQGLDVREAGEQLQTTLETTRFHVKRIMAKTGTRRQSQLMRLMLSLPGQS